MTFFNRRLQEQRALTATAERLPSSVNAKQELSPPIEYVLASRRSRVWLKRLMALVFIVIPTALAAVYCIKYAAPMYLSSSRFAIKGQNEGSASSPLGKIMQGAGGGPTGALTDGFAVRDYLASGDALQELEAKIGFVRRMESPRGDFFLELKPNDTAEGVLDFYRRVVKVRYNMVEGIVTLDVYAFSPSDAFAIAQTLTEMAGAFSNNLNRKAAEETVRASKEELRRAEERLSRSRLALNEWRKQNQSLDVEVSAKMIQGIIEQLEKNLADVRSELQQLRSAGLQNSPRRAELENRVRSFTQQIAAENARLTNAKAEASVVNLLGDYQRLSLEQEFAGKAYELALQGMTNAQAVANMQQKFVAMVVAPLLPQKAAWPDVPKVVGLTFIAAVFAYFLGMLAISVLRDNSRS